MLARERLAKFLISLASEGERDAARPLGYASDYLASVHRDRVMKLVSGVLPLREDSGGGACFTERLLGERLETGRPSLPARRRSIRWARRGDT